MFLFGLTCEVIAGGRWELKSRLLAGNGLYMNPAERLLGISLGSRLSGDPAIFGRTFFFSRLTPGSPRGTAPGQRSDPDGVGPEDLLPIPADPLPDSLDLLTRLPSFPRRW